MIYGLFQMAVWTLAQAWAYLSQPKSSIPSWEVKVKSIMQVQTRSSLSMLQWCKMVGECFSCATVCRLIACRSVPWQWPWLRFDSFASFTLGLMQSNRRKINSLRPDRPSICLQTLLLMGVCDEQSPPSTVMIEHLEWDLIAQNLLDVKFIQFLWRTVTWLLLWCCLHDVDSQYLLADS